VYVGLQKSKRDVFSLKFKHGIGHSAQMYGNADVEILTTATLEDY